MVGFDSHLLTVIVFLPLLWAALGLLIPSQSRGGRTILQLWTLLGALITFGLSLGVYFQYNPTGAEFQMLENIPWLPEIGISYVVGMDGISLWLILLTTFLMPIAVLGSFQAVEHRVREYYFLLLALETGMLGAFVALDIFLFYVFWVAIAPRIINGIWK